MRYLVYGTGAVGGLVGGRLALAGSPVTFLVRPYALPALRRDGLRLTGGSHPGHLTAPRLTDDLHTLVERSERPDLVILAVKAWACEQAARSLHAAWDDPPPVLCLLNGIGNEATLARHLGPDRVVPAALTTAVLMPEPGLVRVERERGLDLYSGHPLAPRLAAEFTQAGFRVRQHRDADRMKWSKLITNIVANASSAILGWTPGQVFSHPSVYRLELEALRECLRVMAAQGLRPEGLVGVPVRLLAWSLRLPARLSQPLLRRSVASGRGSKRPSLRADIGRGRSEVDWLNGAIVRFGKQLHVPTPGNDVLFETMAELVHGRQTQALWQDRPESLLARAQEAGVPGIQGYNPRTSPGSPG